MNKLSRQYIIRPGFFASAAAGLLTVQLNAGIIAVPEGMAPPPATLDGYTLTPFPSDVQPLDALVSSVSTPVGGAVSFSSLVQHFAVGDGWSTWSHGYAGDVYWTHGLNSVTLTLPGNTGAFSLYAEPNSFDIFDITATTQNGATITQAVSGSAGASGFGFFATGGDTIQSISVTSAADFAVGEFGIAQVVSNPDGGGEQGGEGGGSVPDSGAWSFALAMTCLGGWTFGWRRRTA